MRVETMKYYFFSFNILLLRYPYDGTRKEIAYTTGI